MSDILKLNISQLIKGFKSKQFSVSEVLDLHLKQAEKFKSLNFAITDTSELAKEQAKESEKRYLNNHEKAIDGISIAVKDIFCTHGIKTTNASKILANFVPQYESTVTEKVFSEGGIMPSKTNMDEFAMGSTNTTSYFGPVINPWKDASGEDLVPGGSSGGSAVAVAVGACMASLGTDTGGSVRQPAAFCGIVGFKPSYGRCSRYGIMAFASSLDQAGVFAKNVEDTAHVSQVIMGYDKKDSTMSGVAVPNLMEAINGNIKGLKIGIPKEYDFAGMDPEIKKLWEDVANNLRQEGAEIIDISLPNTQYGVSSYYIIAPAEASSNLARYDGVRYGLREYTDGMSLDEMYEATRASGFGDEVKRRIMIGTHVLSAGSYDKYFAQAQRVRRLMAQDFIHAFNDVDIILTPVTPTAAISMDAVSKQNPVQIYYNDVFTIPVNMAGLPAISIPGRINSNGLPISIQLIGKRFDEYTLFRAARAAERSLSFEGFKI